MIIEGAGHFHGLAFRPCAAERKVATSKLVSEHCDSTVLPFQRVVHVEAAKVSPPELLSVYDDGVFGHLDFCAGPQIPAPPKSVDNKTKQPHKHANASTTKMMAPVM